MAEVTAAGSAMVRVFICTSHISSLYMSLHARATWKAGMRDVLLIDTGLRRTSVINAILGTTKLHQWSIVHNFSARLADDRSFKPGWRKRLTREWKNSKLVRPVYGWLLQSYLQRRDARFRPVLHDVLHPVTDNGAPIEVFAHTETYLQRPLLQLHPYATIAFFEHGQGDYIHILSGNKPRGPLHALFAAPYRRFLEERGVASEWVRPLLIGDDFPSIANDLLRSLPAAGVSTAEPATGRILVFILLEAVDMYQVPSSFWGAYIDHVLAAIEEPRRYHFLLKPHPSQSPISLQMTLARCSERGISFTVLDAPEHQGIAAEILFARWSDRTEHVFCLVSTACFYLSQLYRDPRIKYHYSTTFFERWTGDAPPQFKRLFSEMKPLITKVLAERCQPY